MGIVSTVGMDVRARTARSMSLERNENVGKGDGVFWTMGRSWLVSCQSLAALAGRVSACAMASSLGFGESFWIMCVDPRPCVSLAGLVRIVSCCMNHLL